MTGFDPGPDGTDDLVLHPDVCLLPADRLSPDLRARLAAEPGDLTVSRKRSRHPSSIVDAATGRLLEHFRLPCTIAAAVSQEAARLSVDPLELLREAHDTLVRLIERKVLVRAGVDLQNRPCFQAGDDFHGGEILRCLHRMEDTELYLLESAGRKSVLKIAKRGNPELKAMFRQERLVLERLGARSGGALVPDLLDDGEDEGRPFLLLSFWPGVDAETAMASRRRVGVAEEKLSLVLGLARAYSALHEAGVIHVDTHPKNVLVGRGGEIRLIDFGLSRLIGESSQVPLGGIAFYASPEQAQAELTGKIFEPTAASEQYSLAAMLYRLLTGRHYCRFSLQRKALLRQLTICEPLPFGQADGSTWPEMERVLGRALSKLPEERFTDVAAFADALAGVSLPPRSAAVCEVSTQLKQSWEWVRQKALLDGEWLRTELPPPRSSLKMGAAGIAYGLYRLAGALEDGELLAAADLWAHRAVKWAGSPEAFTNTELGFVPEKIGMRSPYHTKSGAYLVQALIAAARSAENLQKKAMEGFLEAAKLPTAGPDLTLGDSGSLLASIWLLDRTPNPQNNLRVSLLEWGDSLTQAIWRHPDLAASPARSQGYLGMAHGWAGYLYAALEWSRVRGEPVPSSVTDGLRELALLGRPTGRGRRWPTRLSHPEEGMAGWCHGSAGYVLLWCLAAQHTANGYFLELAEDAAWDAWDEGSPAASLCCGLVGRAFALLRMYRSTGDVKWCRRAEDLTLRTLRQGQFGDAYRHGLFRGELGLAVLAANVLNPEVASFPCVEAEDWL